MKKKNHVLPFLGSRNQKDCAKTCIGYSRYQKVKVIFFLNSLCFRKFTEAAFYLLLPVIAIFSRLILTTEKMQKSKHVKLETIANDMKYEKAV